MYVRMCALPYESTTQAILRESEARAKAREAESEVTALLAKFQPKREG